MRCDVRRKFRLRLNGTFGGRTFRKPLRCRNYDTSAVRTTCGKVCRTFSKFLVQQGFRKRSGYKERYKWDLYCRNRRA